jgi:Alginate export
VGKSRRSIRMSPVVSTTLVILLSGAHAARAAQGTGPPPPPAPTASPPAPVPFPNRLNHVLPIWLRVRAEFRERMESIDNAGFVGGRDDTYFLSRLRVTATVAPSKSVSFQLQAQDARVAGKEVGVSGVPFTGPIDIRMAFADLGASSGPLTARIGRQELFFGEQRLVGHGNWVNAARTFDAGRLTLRRTGLQVDLFAASLVRILPDEWDKSGNGNRFYGTYAATTALVPKSTVEPYVFWREDRGLRTESGGTGNLHQGTTGVRWNGSWPTTFEYDVETALQRGSLGSDTVRAWAGHVRIKSGSFGPALRVTSEYNYASGDADPTDGIRGTFDQLYPTPHDKYGLADQVGWRNIHHVRAGFDLARIKTLPITVNYHTWWLAEAADGLYLASGALLARVPGGADSRHVGQELDVQVSRTLTPYLQLAAGYAYISPGGFLEQATPGASYSTPFVMLTYVFLAEK